METIKYYILHYVHAAVIFFYDPERVRRTLLTSGKWFAICAVIFILLALIFPGRRHQPHFRRDMLTDGLYWFIGPLFYNPISNALILYLLASFAIVNSSWLNYQAQSRIAEWPVLVQVVLMLLSADILQYWMHRLFHSSMLWRFHSIHHSARDVDWMTSARFHPINILLYSTLMNALVFLLGFSPEAYDALFLFNVLYSPLVHANLNWNYGPFKYVLASPVFHRWHHTHPDEGGNKNFAPTFPFLDVMFGTFYMPKGVQPENFGAHNDTVPEDFLGQLTYPFRKAKPAAQKSEPEASPLATKPL